MRQIYNYHGVKCIIKKDRYGNNGRTALILEDEDGHIVTVATVNVPEEKLAENEVIIKDYSENKGMLDWLIKNEIVEYTGRYVTTGFVMCPICVLKI
jgi:hypothetical protein